MEEKERTDSLKPFRPEERLLVNICGPWKTNKKQEDPLQITEEGNKITIVDPLESRKLRPGPVDLSKCRGMSRR